MAKAKKAAKSPDVETESTETEPTETYERPTLAELQAAEFVDVRYLGEGWMRIAGLCLTSEFATFPVEHVRSQGASYLDALATDESIEVRITK